MEKKKLRILVVSCLVFVMAFFVVACGETEPIDNNNIGNVMKGGERPDYDNMFDYESGFKPSEVSDINTLTIQSGKVTFAGGSNTASVTKSDPMPAVTNNNTGTDIAGWYNVNSTTSIWKQTPYVLRDRSASEITAFAMPAQNITIAPFFVGAGQRPLIPASQSIDTNSALATRVGTKFYETDIGTQIGAEFTYKGGAYPGTPSGSLSGSDGFFRMLTSCASDKALPGAIGAGNHTFHYWFKNLGKQTMKFKVYQGNSGTNIYSGANTVEITLNEGETWSGSITINNLNANTNALTFMVFSSVHTANNANFAMVMSKNPASDVA